MRKINFLIIILLLFSCDNDESYLRDVDFSISLITKDKVDLLNPNNKLINTNDIKIYHKNFNGERILYDKKYLDNPTGYSLMPPRAKENLYWLGITLNTSYIKGNKSTTILSIGGEIEYEITAFFSKGDSYFRLNKVLINDKLINDKYFPHHCTIVFDINNEPIREKDF